MHTVRTISPSGTGRRAPEVPLMRGRSVTGAGLGMVPPAKRGTRADWRDPRLVLGVAIVAISVLIGARTFATADQSVRVWTLRHALPAGYPLQPADLSSSPVRLSSDQVGRYLQVGAVDPVGRRLSRRVGADELLPRGALADPTGDAGAQVAVAVASADLPAAIGAGSVVDVWATAQPGAGGGSAAGGRPPAVLVLPDVVVVEVAGRGDGLSDQGTRSVVVAVPRGEPMAEVLGALAGARAVLTLKVP